MYTARNKDNSLMLWTVKPDPKDKVNGYWQNPTMFETTWISINPKLFPNLSSEDEPIEVELIAKDELERLKYKASQAPTTPYMGG